MDIKFSGRPARRIAAGGLALALSAAALIGESTIVAAPASARSRATTTTTLAKRSTTLSASTASATGTPTGTTQVEAQQLQGTWTQVADTQATNGTAVVINGAVGTTTSFAPGAYLMSVRVRSAGARIVLGVNQQQVTTATLAGGWQVVSSPVYLTGSTIWGVMPIARLDGVANQPVYLDWMSMQSTTPGYTTLGNKIVDPTGHAVTPRGVNRDGLQANPPNYYWMNDNDFQAMYLWGATMVRLPVDQAFWLSTNCEYDSTYMQHVDAAVTSITSRGMIALISLQHAGDGQNCGPSYLSDMADDNSVAFWTQVASRYKSNPLVAFDLFNEPRNILYDVWHDGGMVDSWHAVGMQTLYNTVRTTGATNLVFISGLDMAYYINVAINHPVDGYGIVYAPHLYLTPAPGQLPSDIDNVIPPVAARYPVVITELGTITGTAAYNAKVIAYAEAHGLGWAAWKWYEQPAQYALLQSFVSYAPSPAGQPVRDALWKARGWTTWGH